MIRRPPRSTLSSSSAASDVYKRQGRGENSTRPQEVPASITPSTTRLMWPWSRAHRDYSLMRIVPLISALAVTGLGTGVFSASWQATTSPADDVAPLLVGTGCVRALPDD